MSKHQRTTPNIIGCEKCGSAIVGVTDSRPGRSGFIRRRRRCQECHHRWTTFEIPADSMARVVGADEWADLYEATEDLRPVDRRTLIKVARFLAQERRAGR